MKIKCIDGYFIFEPQKLTQLSDFIYLTGFDLVRHKDFYTFRYLSELESFCVKGINFGNLTAKITYEGEPWDILNKNGFVYDFNLNALRDINGVTTVIGLRKAENYFISNGLIQPGSINGRGLKIKGYECYFSRAFNTFKYSEVTFV